MKQDVQLVKYVFFSASALVIILMIGFFSQHEQVTFLDKIIVGSIFILSLLFGISLAISPGWYKRQKKNNITTSKKMNSVNYIAHHPNCEGFSNHIFVTKNKSYCAGCLGLIIGSIITIMLILLYITFDFTNYNFSLVLILGIFLVIILLTIYLLKERNPYIRILSNILFVVSFFIMIISILEITGDFSYGLLTELFSFLLVDTRIHISKWSHSNICRNCKKDCKMY